MISRIALERLFFANRDSSKWESGAIAMMDDLVIRICSDR